MNSNNNVFKYIFAAVVVILVGYIMYVIVQNRSNVEDYNLDHTSTLSNIQTDLRFSIAALDTINPILSNNRNVQEVTKIIYDPLVTLNGNYKLEYCLAEEIAKTDNLTYVVKLRNGVLWEDRTNFTADDVKYTIELLKWGGFSTIYSENVKYIDYVEVIDSTSLKIVLTEPVAFFEYNLTFPIMCQSYYHEQDFATSEKVPIGTGMFKIAEISSNVIKLARNEYYWNANKQPMATEITINLYNTIGEAYTAFKNGELDLLSVKISNVEDYIGLLGYDRIEYKAREFDFLSFNTANPLLSDPIVRKAISLVIDKNNIVATALGRGYVPSNFSLDMGNWLYTKDMNIGTNTEEATQLLMNNGWSYLNGVWQKREDGNVTKLSFSITVNSNNDKRVAVAEILKNQLATFGIPVTIKSVAVNTYADAINNRNYDCAITGINMGFSPSLTTFFADGNIANYYNSEVTDIMNIISDTNDDGVLYEKYNRLYDIYLEDCPYIGLYRNTEVVVSNQNLVSNMTPNCFNIYHNIEKWYRQ